MRTTPALLALLLFGCTTPPPDEVILGDDDAGDDDDGGDDDTAGDDDDAGDDDAGDDDAGDDDAGDDDAGDDDAAGDDDVGDDDTTPPPAPVRFVALGDTGEGNAAQYAVAGVIETVCAAQGCDFGLLLGDNFYDVGVDSVTDPQWDDKFELPYQNIPFDHFYPVLGNHDGGLWGTGVEIWKGDLQVDYTAMSPSGLWNMPARAYKHSHGPQLDLFALDTSLIFFDGFGEPFVSDYSDSVDDQADWLQQEWAGASTGTWRIAYGHHPYLSNGPHGNAGMYEGVPFVPFVSGNEIKDFMEANICGEVDLYICGHDHSRQWMVDTCDGTELIIAGAGAKTSDLGGNNPSYFEDVSQEGFVWFEIDGNTMTVQFWNQLGVMDYEGVITK